MIDPKLKILENLSLLLIEDDAQMLNNMERIYKIFFKNIYCASNGAEAIDIYDKESIDVVISDYILPIMNGAEICEYVRKEDSNLPFIIITSKSDEEKLLRLVTLNLTDYVIKPINYEKITSSLQKVVSKIENEDLLKENIIDTIFYDKTTKSIIKDETYISLTKNESIFMELFLKYKNSLVTKEMIYEAFWNRESFSEQSIKNTIFRLRQKIGMDIIINVKQFGYILKTI